MHLTTTATKVSKTSTDVLWLLTLVDSENCSSNVLQVCTCAAHHHYIHSRTHMVQVIYKNAPAIAKLACTMDFKPHCKNAFSLMQKSHAVSDAQQERLQPKTPKLTAML